MKRILATLAILWTVSAALPVRAVELDSALPSYKATSGVSGTIKSVGSDSLNNLMTLWAEGFRGQYPNVTAEIEGKGSSTAPPALIAGTSNFGPMSRQMKSKEKDAFVKKFGYEPTAARVAVDALAVFVNKDNPVECLSLDQLDAIFSKTRRRGAPAPALTWGDVGVTGTWANKPISLYGRNSASGTYGYFKKVALKKGDYRDTVKEQPGSSAVVQSVATDTYGIGYSGIGYKTADVKAVALSKKKGAPCYAAAADNAYSGRYPLARFLYVYTNKKPNEDLDPLRAEFFKYIFSKRGQEVVVKDGYYPVSRLLAEQDLKKLGIR